jgi:hypothetical protein
MVCCNKKNLAALTFGNEVLVEQTIPSALCILKLFKHLFFEAGF